MNLIRNNWSNDDYNEFINYLLSLEDIKYKVFTRNLIPGKNNIIGIRIPILKKIAKDISKGDYISFLQYNKDSYYEETLVYGFVIGYMKDVNLVVDDYLDRFVNKIDNWATCDLFVSNLHIVLKNRDLFFNYIVNCFETKENNWIFRFGYVMLLNYYILDDYLDYIFKICNFYQGDFYYVNMAIAWLISLCYIKYPDKTLCFIKDNKLNKFTLNKCISKICDSKRVSLEEKKMLKAYKKNKQYK